jgi:RNA polymerase-binding transcription factor DksA
MTKEQQRKEMIALMQNRDDIITALERTKQVGLIAEYNVRGFSAFYLYVDGIHEEIQREITAATIKILESKLRSIRAKIGKIKIK